MIVTVFPAHPRNGWIAAVRNGDIIIHKRLTAPGYDAEGARAQAVEMFPDHTVIVPALGEKVPS